MPDLSSRKAAAMVGVNSSGCSVKRVVASLLQTAASWVACPAPQSPGVLSGSKMPPGGGLSTAQIATVSAY